MMQTVTSAPRHRSGFMRIAILLVVVNLGILAAVIIPQFTNAADDASISLARTPLQTMRSQIELYRAQNGLYPTADGSTQAPMGAVVVPKNQWDDLIHGNYMRSTPVWPSLFSERYTASSGDLALVLATPFYDVNGDGTADAADATVVAAW